MTTPTPTPPPPPSARASWLAGAVIVVGALIAVTVTRACGGTPTPAPSSPAKP